MRERKQTLIALVEGEFDEIAFQMIDRNGDGYVNPREFFDSFEGEYTLQQVSQMYREADLDKNNLVSRDEFAAFVPLVHEPEVVVTPEQQFVIDSFRRADWNKSN